MGATASCSSRGLVALLAGLAVGEGQRQYTAIPNREVQGFYREIRVQGNSNYMLCQCTGFEGSNFNEIQGNICILYRN